MKLSDIVGNSGLAIYAEIALTLFLIAFVLVALRLLFTRRERYEHVAQLPLEDDEPPFNVSPRNDSVHEGDPHVQ